MANDLAAMKARIAFEIGQRDDLDTQIADAINTAIAAYQKERFRFSDTSPVAPLTFNTVPAQFKYPVASIPAIQTMKAIDYLMVMIGDVWFDLPRYHGEEIWLLNQSPVQEGQPYAYAVEGETVLLYPTPNAVYLCQFGAFVNVAAPASDTEANNRWMTDGELLIRSRAKFELATHVTRNAKMAQMMSPDPPNKNGGTIGASWRAFTALKGEMNRFKRTGRVEAMQF